MKENNNKNSVELCVLCGEPEAVILANGDYPTHPIPLQILANAPYIICCDGGADAYIDRGNVPDVIIGDGDSRVKKTAGNIAIFFIVSPTRKPTTRPKP